MNTKPTHFFLRSLLAVLLVTQPITTTFAAAPAGTVVNGEVTFTYNGKTTTIKATDRAIIEYLRFAIERGETVEFVLPDSTSRVLNRITGGDPTSILGQLKSNGIVYFVNPAGIYFGQHAIVDVGQIFAAAGSLSNSDFLARNDNFTRLSGQVHNEGTINANAIHLIGQNVRNTGALNAPAGLVMLAAGDDVLIGRRGEHVFVNATPATRQASPVSPGVENTGQINAQGGRALLAAGDLYAVAVQNSGIIRAHDVELAGQGSGEVWNRGAIDASSADATGGKVQITGQYVGLDAGSTIDASGATGGGQVLVGGDYQGANTAVRNATATYVAEGARINADATTTGAGGRVIVWADDTTRFHGDISATGFSSGGFAEVSGKKHLLYTGLADLRSANGLAGTLLLDPDNITISGTGSSDTSFAAGVFTTPPNGDFNLFVGDLTTQLALSDVTVKTNTGNITVDTAISLAAYTLTLDAGGAIAINANIGGATGSGLILKAVNDIVIATGIIISSELLEFHSTSGDIRLLENSTVSHTGISGDLIINGGLNVDASASINISGTSNLIVNARTRDVTIGADLTLPGISVTNARNITVAGLDVGAMGGQGDLQFVGNGVVTLGGVITVGSGGSGNISITSGTTVSTGGVLNAWGDITLTGGLYGDMDSNFTTTTGTMTVNAQNRDVSLFGFVDTRSLSITNASNITINGFVTTGMGGQTYSASNNITIGGELATSGGTISLTTATGTTTFTNLATITSDPAALTINGGAYFEADPGDSILGYIEAININGQGRDVTIARHLSGGGINVENASNITISGNVRTDLNDQTYSAINNILFSGTFIQEGPGVGISFTTATGTTTIASTAGVQLPYYDPTTISITGGARIENGADLGFNTSTPLLLDINGSGRDVYIGADISLYTGTLAISNARDLTLAGNIESDFAINYTAARNLTVSGTLQTINTGDSITLTASTGTVSLTTTGAIDAGGAITITGGLATAAGSNINADGAINVNASGRDIAISGTATSFAGGTYANAASITVNGHVENFGSATLTFVGNGAMTIGGVISAGSGGNLSLTSSTGTIALASTATIDGRQISLTGGVDAAAGSTIDNIYGDNITIDALGRDVSLRTDLAFSSGSLAISNARDLTLANVTTADAQSYTAARNLTLTGTLQTTNSFADISLTAQTGTLALTGAGAIESAGNVTGTAGAAITIATAGNTIFAAGDTTLATTGDINISGAVYATNTITLTAGGTTALASTAVLAGMKVLINGGLDIASGADINTDLGAEIQAQGKNVNIRAALSLPELSIRGARYISIAAVETFGDQTYSFAANGNGAMQLNGALVSANGDISIGSNSDFPADYATIFSTSPDGILISATAGNVTIGHNETLLAYHDGSASPAAGTITIEAGGSVDLGSVSAAKSLSVNATTINLNGRVFQAPSITFAATGALNIPPVDPSIPTAIIATAAGGLSLPATINGVYDPKIIPAAHMTGDVMNDDFFPPIAPGAGAPFPTLYGNTQFWSDSGSTTPAQEEKKIDVIADETNPANRQEQETKQLQERIFFVVQSAIQEITAQNTISAATADLLRKLGIFPRPITPRERQELSDYFGTLQQMIPSEVRAPENYRVADGRLSEQTARTAIAAYNKAFEPQGASRVPELQARLLETYREFRAANPSAPATAYIPYIDNLAPGTPATRELHAFFDDVRALFAVIDDLGLTANERLVSKNVILRSLRVQGIPSGLLAPLIQNQPDQPIVTASAY